MAKHGARPLPRWMSATKDCRESRFVQVGNSLLFNERFRNLSAGAFKLYICCAMEAAGFIQKDRSGQSTRTANDYSFCFRWLDDG